MWIIFRFFLKRLRKISEKRLRVVEIFDTLKKHKKIHALSAWSFRFYRSLWLCSWPSKIRSSTSAMNLFIVIAHPSFSQFSSWLYACFRRFARRKLWFFCKLCVKCLHPRRSGTSSYAPDSPLLFRKIKKSVYIPRGYYYNIRIFPDGTRQAAYRLPTHQEAVMPNLKSLESLRRRICTSWMKLSTMAVCSAAMSFVRLLMMSPVRRRS